MANELVKRIEQAQLTEAQSNELLNNFADYYKIAEEWNIKASAIVVTNESQTAEMQMARAGRLFLKDKRVAVEKKRKALKEASLREGKAIDSIAKYLTELIEPIEKDLEAKEKFVEIKKEAERRALHEKRVLILNEFKEFLFENVFYGDMTDEDFNNVVDNCKSLAERKKAEETARQEAEAKRIQEEKRLREENEKLIKERREREQEQERLRKQKEEAEHKLLLEKQKVDKLKKEQEETERRAKEEKERTEQEERDRLDQLSDKEKMIELRNSLNLIVVKATETNVRSKKNKRILNEVIEAIEELIRLF